ncbi:MAG: hypothetical protein FJ109_15770, partial [Deltaproteobacteria bacterium]|nr:hypothetical protein [Deltaproteobacteria bacterium]
MTAAVYARPLLVVSAVLSVLGCGGKDPSQVTSWPEPDTACTELGLQACSPTEGDKWLVLRCSVDGQGNLWWRVSLVCAFGCKDGKCLTLDGDVADIRYPEIGADVTDAVVGTDGGEPDAEENPDTTLDICIPDCSTRLCGDDGCGGTCGECPKDFVCITDEGKCCMPECKGKLCGDDGCGGSCGECPEGHECGKY